MSKQSWMKDL